MRTIKVIFLLSLIFYVCLDTFAEEKKIIEIKIEGNKNVSDSTIISKIKTRPGSIYKPEIIREDIKRLYVLGFFSDIKVDLEDYKDGYRLIFKVTEKPIIKQIQISGGKILKERKIKEEIKSQEGQYLDYALLKEDIERIKKLYAKMGFSLAKIDYETQIDEEKREAFIKINISEGKRLKIRKIIFEGNETIPTRRLLKVIKTRRASFFNSGFLKEDILEEDLERIKDFYKREGFSDVTVEKEMQIFPERSAIYISFKIQEGKRYRVGEIEILGAEAIPKDEILKKIKMKKGEIFTEEALHQDISEIQGLYFERGYIFAQVKEVTYLDPQTQRINITYNIEENEVAYVNRINIQGNIKTKDVVIRRELRIKPGDRFDGNKLKRSKERLYNLGFFEEINYDIQSTEDPKYQDLIVEVKETKTGEFSFGGGYSTIDEFIGFIEVEQRNFDWKNPPTFTGDGQDLRIHLETGTVTQNLELSFTEPWVFDYPISFGFDAYRRAHERETDVGYGYDEVRKGGDIRFGKELSEYVRANFAYRYDIIEISDISPEATTELKKEEGENTISSIELGLSQDKRDNIFNPTRGRLLSGSLEIAGGAFGGDKDFFKIFLLSSFYFPFLKKSVLEIRFRVGLADAYGNSDEIPIYERFFAGGAYSIRGYNERKVGPIDPVSKDPLGGESLFVANLEYTYPLIEFIKGAVFFDTGNVWSKISDFGSGGLKSSVGLGVRIKTPIGPIRLDYGFPLNKEPGEEKKEGKFHFSFSRGF